MIRGEFHPRGGRNGINGEGGQDGVGKAETEREKAARRRMMNGGMMVVLRAKPKPYEWWDSWKGDTRGEKCTKGTAG